MMFEKREHAIRALSKITTCRASLKPGELITPAEDWLLGILLSYGTKYKLRMKGDFEIAGMGTKENIKPKDMRRLFGIARYLQLWPIPNWWLVKLKIEKSNNPKKMADWRMDEMAEVLNEMCK